MPYGAEGFPDRWLTATEAAIYTGYNVATIRRAARAQTLRAWRRGDKGDWRFKLADLDEWTRGRDDETPPELVGGASAPSPVDRRRRVHA